MDNVGFGFICGISFALLCRLGCYIYKRTVHGIKGSDGSVGGLEQRAADNNRDLAKGLQRAADNNREAAEIIQKANNLLDSVDSRS